MKNPYADLTPEERIGQCLETLRVWLEKKLKQEAEQLAQQTKAA